MPRQLVGIKELSEYLHVSVDTALQLVFSARIPYIKRGGVMKFDLEEVKCWIKKRKAAARFNLQKYNDPDNKDWK